MAYTIDIINQAAGTSYVYDILSLNAYIIQQGGTGGHTYRIDALNELCTIAGANAGWNYEIDALNAISTAIGGTGDYTYEYEAWTEIAGIGFDAAYDPATDTNLNLYYSSRSGNTLLETGSGSSRNAQIMPRVCKFTAGTEWLNFGTSYNPTTAVITVYSAFMFTGTTGTGTIMSTSQRGSPYTQISCVVDMSNGKMGTYTNAWKWSTATATRNAWCKVIWRFTLGASGKVEVAIDGGNFETLHEVSMPTSLISGNGVLAIAGWQGTTGTGANFFKGTMAEVKIFESSKTWANIDTTPEMWIPLVGNGKYEYGYHATTPITAAWAVTSWRFDWHKYGSTCFFDIGWELWRNTYAQPILHLVPKGGLTTNLTSDGFTKLKTYDGSATGWNFGWAYIDFDPTGSAHADLDCWNRDNTTIFNTYARTGYTLNGYIQRYQTGHPYWWFCDELNRWTIQGYTNTNYKNTIYPKVTDNSMGFDARKSLVEILCMDQADATKTAKVETYTGDKFKDAGMCLTFDDLTYIPARPAQMQSADNTIYPLWFWRFSWFIDVPNEAAVTSNLSIINPILARGHEVQNHSVNHIAWATYLTTHTPQEYCDNEVFPAQTSIYNVLGVTPQVYGYQRDMGQNNTVNSILLADGFDAVRPVRTGYNGDNMSIAHYTPGSGSGVIQSWMTNDNTDEELLTQLAAANTNNTIYVLCLHAVAADNAGTNITQERLEKLMTYCFNNNLKMYLISELPNL